MIRIPSCNFFFPYEWGHKRDPHQISLCFLFSVFTVISLWWLRWRWAVSFHDLEISSFWFAYVCKCPGFQLSCGDQWYLCVCLCACVFPPPLLPDAVCRSLFLLPLFLVRWICTVSKARCLCRLGQVIYDATGSPRMPYQVYRQGLY